MSLQLIDSTDYDIASFADTFADDDRLLIQAVLLRLRTKRGAYWYDPLLGSRLYLLRRAKDVPRVRKAAVDYAREALAPLMTRVKRLNVEALPPVRGRLDLVITLVRLGGDPIQILFFVKVGG